ncbi:MAG TPA: hypothetical protein DCQ92_19100 [Verrucomicrobia subdivision 3 bacterium]|nr:hypothetical protein [Limisphaerales bacterium]
MNVRFSNFLNSLSLRFAVYLLVCFLSFSTVVSAAVTWGYIHISPQNISLLAILDDSSGKIYLQASGPAAEWFAWGFNTTNMNGYAVILNSGTLGNYFESTMAGDTMPPKDAIQEMSGSYCVTNNMVYYFLQRKLTSDASPFHYSFTTQPTNLPIVWAVGPGTRSFVKHALSDRAADTLSSSNAPPPQFRSISPTNGVAILSMTNLIVAVTNRVQFKNDLNSTNWTTLTNLLFLPPCGSPLLSIVTNLSTPLTNSNSRFFRITQ